MYGLSTRIANDENGHIVSLTPKHRIINDTLVHFYQKRHHLVKSPLFS